MEYDLLAMKLLFGHLPFFMHFPFNLPLATSFIGNLGNKTQNGLATVCYS